MDLREVGAREPESRHPWETARAEFFLGLLRSRSLPPPGGPVLDVGAGDAWFASRLAAETGAAITCWDSGYAGGAGPRGAHPSLRFVDRPEAGRRFPLALLLDVLEHVEDDAAFLREIVAERLAPAAHVLVSVPAWQPLFSSHDAALRHHRRYSPASARRLVERAGLRVLTAGGLFHSLLLPRALAVVAERLRSPGSAPSLAGDWRHGPLVTGVVLGALRADAALSRAAAGASLELPGLSWWALCER